MQRYMSCYIVGGYFYITKNQNKINMVLTWEIRQVNSIHIY